MRAVENQPLEQLIRDATRVDRERGEAILRRSLGTLGHIANELPYAGADARQAATVALADIRDQLAAAESRGSAATVTDRVDPGPWPTEAPGERQSGM
jgi:hypothetical protein